MRRNDEHGLLVGENPAPTGPAERTERPSWLTRWRLAPEHLGVIVLACAVFAVHDIPRILHQPMWADENWVATTTRYPLSKLSYTTASTPIGWTFVLHFLPFHGPALRLLTMVFAATAVVMAYQLAANLGWPDRTRRVAAGLAAAYATLVVPGMLVRNDLKQYTADAAGALVILVLVSRAERDSSPRNLGYVAVGAIATMYFSHTSVFVTAAGVGSLAAVTLLRRQWRTALAVGVAGVVAALGMFATYKAFDQRAVSPALTNFWRQYYVTRGHGLTGVRNFLSFAWHSSGRYYGLGPPWLLFIFFAAGIVTIARCGRWAIAVAIPMIWVEMFALSALQKYPFGDQRTSTFLFVVSAVVAAVGVVGIATEVGRRVHRTAAFVAVIAAAAIAFTANAGPYFWEMNVRKEDVPQQVAYVFAHRQPDDVVLVDFANVFGFAYDTNLKLGTLALPSVVSLVRYIPSFPDNPEIVVPTNRSYHAIKNGLDKAQVLARQRNSPRLWVIRDRMNTSEQRAWVQVLANEGLTITPVGPDGLGVLTGF